MIGITSYGAYIPFYRMNRMTIYGALGWLNPASLLPGEKAVANYDEDSLTMAVASAMDCLGGIERNKIGGVFFATTTAPYRERQTSLLPPRLGPVPSSLHTMLSHQAQQTMFWSVPPIVVWASPLAILRRYMEMEARHSSWEIAR
jgi:3-hydroxy-3-methylglutaryl CoA synthase